MSLSIQSKNFLKHATASPDFTGNAQIPDGSGNPTFTQRFTIQQTVVCPAGKVTVIVCTPTVPAAFYMTSYVPDSSGNMPASTILYPIDYIQCQTLFPEYYAGTPGPTVNTRQVTSGRVVSRASELVCATNPLKQDGTIISYKTPLELTNAPSPIVSPGVLEQSKLLISGGKSLQTGAATTGSYMQFVKEGAYSTVFNRTGGAGDFPFHPVYDNIGVGITVEAPYEADAKILEEYLFKSGPCFMDNNFDSMVYKISPGGADPQTFIIKSWISIEFTTVYGSFLNNISTFPPPRDEKAFRVYGELEENLPVAVPAKDNPNFWQDMLSIIRPVSGLTSALPGIVGTVSKGIHAFSTIFDKQKTRANNPTYAQPAAAQNTQARQMSVPKPQRRRPQARKKPRARRPRK